MPSLTWKVFNVHASEVAQSVLVVGGVVPDDAIVFAGEVVKTAVDRCHPGQVIQHFFNLFDNFLRDKTRKSVVEWRQNQVQAEGLI